MGFETIHHILSDRRRAVVAFVVAGVTLAISVVVYLYAWRADLYALEVTATAIGATASLIVGIVAGHRIRNRFPAARPSDTVEPAEPELPEVPATPFDSTKFMKTLTGSDEPLRELVAFVQRTREAEAAYDGLFEGRGPEAELAPSPVARYLATELESTGLVERVDAMPEVRAAYLPRSRKAYLTFLDRTTTWGDQRTLLAVEAAINRALLANSMMKVTGSTTPDQIVRYMQTVEASITAQMPSIISSVPAEARAASEWDVRQTIATGLETLQSPYRIDAQFRTNVADHLAMFDVNLPDPSLFSDRMWADAVGRVVPTTTRMREIQASLHAAQLCILLAAYVFATTSSVDEVRVVARNRHGVSTACVITAAFSRTLVTSLDLRRVRDPYVVMVAAGANLELEDGVLQPIDPDMSLDDSDLCPAERTESVSLSSRTLPAEYADALGATRVRDLAIRESDYRMHVAEELSRLFSESAEHNVHVILDKLEHETDASVKSAGERAIGRIIDGSWDTDAGQALLDEFAEGDGLTQAVSEAVRLMLGKDMRAAADTLTAAIAQADAANPYEDSPAELWRSFDTYAARLVYNRLVNRDRTPIRLVPESYVNALLLLSSCDVVLGDNDRALAAALRAHELAPLNTNASLRMARAYENLGEHEMAFATLVELLELAHDPESIGVAYYRLAYIAWQMDRTELALACYDRSCGFMSSVSINAHLELVAFERQLGRKHDPDRTEEILSRNLIPLAPTDSVSRVLVEAAKASVNAGIFPVARQVTSLLTMLSGDDAMADVAASLDGDPDF